MQISSYYLNHSDTDIYRLKYPGDKENFSRNAVKFVVRKWLKFSTSLMFCSSFWCQPSILGTHPQEGWSKGEDYRKLSVLIFFKWRILWLVVTISFLSDLSLIMGFFKKCFQTLCHCLTSVCWLLPKLRLPLCEGSLQLLVYILWSPPPTPV